MFQIWWSKIIKNEHNYENMMIKLIFYFFQFFLIFLIFKMNRMLKFYRIELKFFIQS